MQSLLPAAAAAAFSLVGDLYGHTLFHNVLNGSIQDAFKNFDIVHQHVNPNSTILTVKDYCYICTP